MNHHDARGAGEPQLVQRRAPDFAKAIWRLARPLEVTSCRTLLPTVITILVQSSCLEAASGSSGTGDSRQRRSVTIAPNCCRFESCVRVNRAEPRRRSRVTWVLAVSLLASTTVLALDDGPFLFYQSWVNGTPGTSATIAVAF